VKTEAVVVLFEKSACRVCFLKKQRVLGPIGDPPSQFSHSLLQRFENWVNEIKGKFKDYQTSPQCGSIESLWREISAKTSRTTRLLGVQIRVLARKNLFRNASVQEAMHFGRGFCELEPCSWLLVQRAKRVVRIVQSASGF
jgi:hypothetical protein